VENDIMGNNKEDTYTDSSSLRMTKKEAHTKE
jgi:hypothetical protein